MTRKAIKVAIVGASGYSGQELLRRLVQHPGVELISVTSRQHRGERITDNFARFAALPRLEGMRFEAPSAERLVQQGVEVAFLALPHGVSLSYAHELLAAGLRVIDLSADYRLDDAGKYEEYYGKAHPQPELLKEAVYGLVEWNRAAIRDARLIATPGCYPTSILLPLLPLLKEGLIEPKEIIANSLSGVSGAGRDAKVELLYVEVAESLRAYGLPKHRHLAEMEQELAKAAGQSLILSFHPHLVPVRRGILSTISARASASLDSVQQLTECYEDYYGKEAMIRLLGAGALADSKQVVDTGFLDLGWLIDERTNRVILSSAEDNLAKGAATQALQCLDVWLDQEAEKALVRV